MQQCKDNSVGILWATMFINVIDPTITNCLLWTSKLLMLKSARASLVGTDCCEVSEIVKLLIQTTNDMF
jgi:hypothetical protein